MQQEFLAGPFPGIDLPDATPPGVPTIQQQPAIRDRQLQLVAAHRVGVFARERAKPFGMTSYQFRNSGTCRFNCAGSVEPLGQRLSTHFLSIYFRRRNMGASTARYFKALPRNTRTLATRLRVSDKLQFVAASRQAEAYRTSD